MSGQGGAYGTKASDTDFRKKWDKEEYAEKAKKKDEEERERMKENEERMKQGMLPTPAILQCVHKPLGKKPRRGRKDDLPKPTELMKRREGSLELEKNLGKTMVVQNTSGRGPGVPGFYCETCNRTYKDSTGYLDHINGRARKFPRFPVLILLAPDMFLRLACSWTNYSHRTFYCRASESAHSIST